jgi:hypothetical protein
MEPITFKYGNSEKKISQNLVHNHIFFTKVLCMSHTGFFGVAKWQKFTKKEKQ